MSEWIDCREKYPEHNQEVRVWIESPRFSGFERTGNAKYSGFDWSFYDPIELFRINNVTKWKPCSKA